jgi:hypothetical protein
MTSSGGEVSVRLRSRKIREYDGYSDDEDFVLDEIIEEDDSFDDDSFELVSFDEVSFDDTAVEALFEDELLDDLEADEWVDFEDQFEDGVESWDENESFEDGFDDDVDVPRRGRRSWVSAIAPWRWSRRPRRLRRHRRQAGASSIAADSDTTVIRPDVVMSPVSMRAELTVGDTCCRCNGRLVSSGLAAQRG